MLACSPAVKAQDEVETTIAADFVNDYVWRGQHCGDVAVQPTLGIGYKGLSLTAWGSIPLTNTDDSKEFDLTLAYATGKFHVGVTDYYFSSASNFKTGATVGDKYFAYGANSTAHTFEANIGYDFGPVSIDWYTNFAGNDGLNRSQNRAYSSYIELKAPFRLAKLDWEGTVGLCPWASTYYGTNGFACTDVGLKVTKDFLIRQKYHLPIFVGLNANPDSGKFYFLCGLGFRI
jgi:hypothetical protein